LLAGGNSARVASECGKVSSPANEFKCISGNLSHVSPLISQYPRHVHLRRKTNSEAAKTAVAHPFWRFRSSDT
jgi:hypothetical protein